MTEGIVNDFSVRNEWRYSFGAFLAPMAEEFGSGRGATSVFFALTSLSYFGFGALSGVAVDRYGPRRVLLVLSGLLVLTTVGLQEQLPTRVPGAIRTAAPAAGT